MSSAAPLVVAVRELSAQLRNIQENDGWVALADDFDDRRPAAWSATHDYFMDSSAFVFGAYFARAEIIRERLGFDARAAQDEPLIKTLRAAERSLSTWPTSYTGQCTGRDAQVFMWQQRALGQALVLSSKDASVTTYADFLRTKESLRIHTGPIRALLLNLDGNATEDCRWLRLTTFRGALTEVEATCLALLEAESTGPGPAGSSAGAHDASSS